MGCACLEDAGSSALEGACDSGFLGAAEEAGELAADEEEDVYKRQALSCRAPGP